jgi:hypothetical protein
MGFMLKKIFSVIIFILTLLLTIMEKQAAKIDLQLTKYLAKNVTEQVGSEVLNKQVATPEQTETPPLK